MTKLPQFYTLPPVNNWPYVLINARNPHLSYVRRNWKYIKSVIVDSGVEIFRNPQIKDYPSNWWNRLISIYYRARTYVREVWATIPDYPDDYHPTNLWTKDKTNIERTIENIIYALNHYPKINWLIPIQGWNSDPKSLALSIKYLEDYGIIKRKEYFAIANLCVEPRSDIIIKSVSIVRDLLPNKKIHVFGIKLNALRKIHHLIDSFDSFAWTRPVKGQGHSAKNLAERKQFFYDWLERFMSIPKTTSLRDFID